MQYLRLRTPSTAPIVEVLVEECVVGTIELNVDRELTIVIDADHAVELNVDKIIYDALQLLSPTEELSDYDLPN